LTKLVKIAKHVRAAAGALREGGKVRHASLPATVLGRGVEGPDVKQGARGKQGDVGVDADTVAGEDVHAVTNVACGQCEKTTASSTMLMCDT